MNIERLSNLHILHEGAVLTVTINRPETRNALDALTLAEMDFVFSYAEQDRDIRAVVIQGAGGKSFAAGANIQQLHDRKMLEGLLPGMQGVYSRIESSSKVTIALIDGYALGGGCELALSCDIRIATDHAKFGMPELNLGILPGGGGTQRLARMIGKGRALDMILTGKTIDGEEAERIGLVTYVTSREDAEERLHGILESILRKGPAAVLLAKQAVHKGYDVGMEAALWMEKLSQTIAFGTEDKQEGTRAFLEKRQANFQNH